MGTWIEIASQFYDWYACGCRSPCGNVDWNGYGRGTAASGRCRSPCGNVDWNLTMCKVYVILETSFPLWERGLKLPAGEETRKKISRSPCGNVDWNATYSLAKEGLDMSFPLWERGLKYWRHLRRRTQERSFPLWERGLKWYMIDGRAFCVGRSPCGNVDWNRWCKRRRLSSCCRSPCGNVDWNNTEVMQQTAVDGRSPCGNVDWNL